MKALVRCLTKRFIQERRNVVNALMDLIEYDLAKNKSLNKFKILRYVYIYCIYYFVLVSHIYFIIVQFIIFPYVSECECNCYY